MLPDRKGSRSGLAVPGEVTRGDRLRRLSGNRQWSGHRYRCAV